MLTNDEAISPNRIMRMMIINAISNTIMNIIIEVIEVIVKTPYLLSLAAAPLGVSDLTKMPSFSTPDSVPTPRPIILSPRPPSPGDKRTQGINIK